MGKTVIHRLNDIACFESDLGTLDERFFKIKRESEKSLVCPFCMINFTVDDNVTLLASNFKLFPNVMIHRDCFIGIDSFNRIIEIHKEFKEFEQKFRYWL